MNKEMLKIAQAEYERQFEEWTRSMPVAPKILEDIEKIIARWTKEKAKEEEISP